MHLVPGEGPLQRGQDGRVDLREQSAAMAQVAWRLGQKPAHERRAAISREERRRGLGADLGWQVGLPAHIWKVGAHQVEFAWERLEQVAFDQMYAAGEAVLVRVSVRHVQRLAADVPRPDFHGW